MPISKATAIKLNEAHSGISIKSCTSIFKPTKLKIAMRLYSRCANFSSICAKKKYIDRKPRIAKIFELKTKNGSEVMAKIAGTLSKANKTSITSMMISATNKGVA